MAVKSTPVGLERLITMADTEREKKKKVFEDFMKPYKKEDKKENKKDKKKKKKSKPEDLTKSRELDIGSDRDVKTIAERMESAGDLSKEGLDQLIYDMSTKKKLTNSERRRRGLPLLATGKKSGGKVYSRGFRKAKYNG